MSVDITSVPPWKRELLLRKRRLELEERKRSGEDMDKLTDMSNSSNIPSWKRDILRKKQQQRNTVVYANKSDSTSNLRGAERPASAPPHSLALRKSSSTSAVVDHTGGLYERPVSPGVSITMHHLPLPEEELRPTGEFDLDACPRAEGEHILPIVENPWLRSDNVQTKRLLKSPPASRPRHSEGEGSATSQSGPTMGNSCDTTDGPATSRTSNNFEEVFSEENDIAYGRGFVHKLLKKFKHLSARDEKSATLPKSYSKRTQSSDSILEDSTKLSKMSPRGYNTSLHSEPTSSLSKPKAQSMDNLLFLEESEYNGTQEADRSGSMGSPDSFPRSPEHTNHLAPQDSQDDSLGEMDQSLSGSRENIMEEELPRANIVSTTRSVFESISTSPGSSGLYKKWSATSPSSQGTNSSVNGAKTPQAEPPVAPVTSPDSATERLAAPAEIPTSTTTTVTTLTHEDARRSRPPTQDTKGSRQRDTSPSIPVSEESLKNIRSAGKSWYFSSSGDPPPKESHNTRTAGSSQDKTAVASDINANKSKSDREPPVWEVPELVKASVSANRSHVYTAKKPPSTSAPASKPIYNQNNNVNTKPAVSSLPSKPVDNNPPPVAPERKKRAPKPPSQPSQPKVTSPMDNKPATLDNKPKPQTEKITPNSKTVVKNYHDNLLVNNRESSYSNHSNQYNNKDNTGYNHQVDNQQRKSEANRSNLNLNLNNLPPTRTEAKVTEANNRKNTQVKKKRPIPDGPGNMLIRPASNLTTGNKPQQYVSSYMAEYNDVRSGKFEPAQKRPSYYDTYSDEEDDDEVPITNIDDVPVTNIDDLTPESPREGDATIHIFKPRKRFEFEGANVKCGRNLLTKTRNSKKMKIGFNDSATSTYEYPSEQSLLEAIPSQPGYYDYPGGHGNMPNGNTDEEVPDLGEPSSKLKSTPGLGSGGTSEGNSALGMYKSKLVQDYEIGQQRVVEEAPPPRKQPEPLPENQHVKPAESDVTWSDSTISDMLF